LDSFAKAIFVVENITTVDGTVDPARTISGGNTLLENPTAIAVDGRRDVLYVADANQQAVLVFAPASQKNGNVSPTRQLPASGNIQSMSLDIDNNTLYVFNATLQAVQVWTQASIRDGAVPNNTFTIGFLASAIFIDSQRDILYVGDPIAFVINAYEQASTTIGSPTPTRVLDDAGAALDRIDGLTMNILNDFLFTSNSLGPLINVFDNASNLDGEVDPVRVIEGDQTQFSDNLDDLKFLENVLYVNNAPTQIAIFDNANSADGNIAPNRLLTINGSTRIVGFDIDLLH
jgi:hypothetical protein